MSELPNLSAQLQYDGDTPPVDVQNVGLGSRVRHPKWGEGVVCGLKVNSFRISFPDKGVVEIARTFEGLHWVEVLEPAESVVSFPDVAGTLRRLLEEYAGATEYVPLADRWRGGTMILKPANPQLQSKEIPLDTFFHKIVMLRDRLRVLEQKINAHGLLDDAEKVDLQQYITRVYGSLTTFNLLFKESGHQFVGQKGGGE